MKFALLLVVLVTMLAIAPAFATNWTLTDLGYGGACGINDMGQITGYRTDSTGGAEKGFVWSRESGFVDIDASRGQVINNFGQVAGAGWVWSQEQGQIPLSVPGGFNFFAIDGLNGNGQIVGSVKSSSKYRAMLWNSLGEYTDLGLPSDWSSWGYDINETGTVVGEMTNVIHNHAFMWNVTSGFVDLGDFGTSFARADGINDLGQIVGQYFPNGFRHAFLRSPEGVIRDLGTLTGGHHSQAIEINNNGLVIGWSMYIAGNPARHPFVWDKTTGMTDLGLLTGGESGVGDINSRNQVVGYFLDGQGLSHIALWEPVPEPSSLLALGAGISSLLGLLVRRKIG